VRYEYFLQTAPNILHETYRSLAAPFREKDRRILPERPTFRIPVAPAASQEIRVNSLKFYVCATVLCHYECMSDEYSYRASAECREFELPPPDTKRWVTRRKAMIVNAVRAGEISLEEVCRGYKLSVEEFLAWQCAIDTHGVPGLRVTRLQIYRDNPPSRVAKPRS
jgi:Protein of unknown function (DUF1153)